MIETCSCGQPHIPVELRKIDLGPNEILHVVVGLADVGGTPWIPTEDELYRIRDEVAKTFPCVNSIVTHLGIEMGSLDLTEFDLDVTAEG